MPKNGKKVIEASPKKTVLRAPYFRIIESRTALRQAVKEDFYKMVVTMMKSEAYPNREYMKTIVGQHRGFMVMCRKLDRVSYCVNTKDSWKDQCACCLCQCLDDPCDDCHYLLGKWNELQGTLGIKKDSLYYLFTSSFCLRSCSMASGHPRMM